MPVNRNRKIYIYLGAVFLPLSLLFVESGHDLSLVNYADSNQCRLAGSGRFLALKAAHVQVHQLVAAGFFNDTKVRKTLVNRPGEDDYRIWQRKISPAFLFDTNFITIV